MQEYETIYNTTRTSTTTTRRTDTENAINQVKRAAADAGISWSKQAETMARRWLDTVPAELIIDYAIAEAAFAPYPSFRYVAAIMKRLLTSGIHTLEEARGTSAPKAARSAEGRGRVSAQEYQQRDYSQDPPEELPTWMIARWEEMQKQRR